MVIMILMQTILKIKTDKVKTTKIVAIHLSFDLHDKLDKIALDIRNKNGKMAKHEIVAAIVEANIDDVVIQ